MTGEGALGKNLGSKIRDFRKVYRISQEELAVRVGCSAKTIGNIECGRTMPDLRQLAALSRITELSLDDLVFDVKECKTSEKRRVEALKQTLNDRELEIVERVLLLLRGGN